MHACMSVYVFNVILKKYRTLLFLLSVLFGTTIFFGYSRRMSLLYTIAEGLVRLTGRTDFKTHLTTPQGSSALNLKIQPLSL